MTQLSEYLDCLEQTLTRLDRPVVRRLRPGLSSEEILGFSRSLGIPITEEVRDLYQWHDGLSWEDGDVTLDAMSLFPGFHMLTRYEASARYEAFRSTLIKHPGFRDLWNEELLPIFNDGGAGTYFARCSPEEPRISEVLIFRPGESTETLHFSLRDMLQTILECFRTGAYFVGADGTFECDLDEVGGVSARVNPEVMAWRKF